MELKDCRLLIVDDDELLREVLVEIFTDSVCDILEASNGQMAFDLIQTKKPHVVISDVRMPNGDGVFLAQKVHELEGEKPLFFICSGHNDLTTEIIKKFNILHVFEKPFDSIKIIEIIASHVKSSS